MSDLYLVTGFLGSGKTTFLKKFLKIFKEKKIHLIINEYGKEGIDGKLLEEVGTVLDEINNGSIFCSCKLDKFEEVLQKTLLQTPDVIIIEASGLSNPTNVRKIMAQTNKFSGLSYMGSICLIDAKRFHKVYETATVVKKQVAISDIILINKIDIASKDEIENTKSIIKSHQPTIPIYETRFGEIKKEWLNDIKSPTLSAQKPEMESMDITLRSFELEISDNFTTYELEKFINMFLEETYRVKGFITLKNKNYLLDCVGNLFKITEYNKDVVNANKIVILAGNKLRTSQSVKEAIKWYEDKVLNFNRIK